jgi:hypothetical protein
MKVHGGPGLDPGVGRDLAQVDQVERALAAALVRASAAGEWEAVKVLTEELAARRKLR